MSREAERDRFAVYYSESSNRHDTGAGHPENAERMTAAMEGAVRCNPTIRPRVSAADAECNRLIEKVHSARYLSDFHAAAGAGPRFFHSPDNPISAGTYEAAYGAVATAVDAANAIWSERSLTRAFVVARPPGHHAEKEQAMGFCFFNTIACVAERLREIAGIERVFILDWDVHHGNGTQHLFEQRDDVFYASTHRYPFYPGTGASSEIGVGRGRGYTLNVPLDGGAGDAVYLPLMENNIVRAIESFAPQAILVSAGFDSHRRDPLGGMTVSEGAFGQMTSLIVDAANRLCGGRLLTLLEGGYDRRGLADSVEAHVAAMM